MGSPRAIAIGLGAGALAGVVLGEHAAAFDVLADAFIKLLQMTVLPYVVLSLVTGLGSLTAAQAKALALRSGVVLVLLWAIGLALVFVFPLMFPPIETASFFSTTLLEPPRTFDVVELYIPANPFHSLANTVVPAVVLFSVMMGVALIGVEDKGRLLAVLGAARETVSRATGFVVRLAPIGLFAVAAHAVGTLSVEQLGHLQVYLLAYVAMALVGALWLVPGLVTILTPIPYRRVLAVTGGAVLTAFVTAELFVVLPLLAEGTRRLAREHGLSADEASASDVVVAASFNFPHVGKVMTLSFVLFAGWFAGTPLSPAVYPQLAATGLCTLFGNVNVAVPFLLDLFRVPADTYQLFVATSVVNARFGTLLATMHTVAMALVGTWAMAGAWRVDRTRLAVYAASGALLVAATALGVRAVAGWLLPSAFEGRRLVYGRELQRPGAAAALGTRPAPAGDWTPQAALQRIRSSGELRVGYIDDNLPFSYFNDHGRLVGFDVEMALALGRELGARVAFVRVDRADVIAAVDEGVCDLVMSGIALTTDRAAAAAFSKPYLDETLAFIVPDHARSRFASWDSLARTPGLTIGVLDLPYYVSQVERRLPHAKLVPIASLDAMFDRRRPTVDATVLTAERGSAWTLLHPELAVVVPFPDPVEVPLAYPIAPDPALIRLVDAWIDLKRKDGTTDALYAYWILGRDAGPAPRRWSVLRNVLGWVD